MAQNELLIWKSELLPKTLVEFAWALNNTRFGSGLEIGIAAPKILNKRDPEINGTRI